MIYDITPVAKPRMTRRDKWKKRPCVLKYMAFKDECRLKHVNINNGSSITFRIPMPKSWSNVNKKIMDGAPHKKKPDIDNLLKALLDAVFTEDSVIHALKVNKIWAEKGSIEIKELKE